MRASAETLLSHGPFLRSIARSLLHDEHLAEDVVQETWLAAVKHPPRSDKSPKPWLTTVVRNFVRLTKREEGRRRKREVVTAVSEKIRSTEEIVEEESMRRRVVDAVLGLSEPYQSAILHRFYDDQPPRVIAEQFHIPVSTVKTRIQRGLDLLKQRLDADFGGDRRNWCLALAPLAGLKALAPTAGTAVTVSSAMMGASIMSAQLKAVLAAAVVIVGLLAFWAIKLQIQPDKTSKLNEEEVVSSKAVDVEIMSDGHGEKNDKTDEQAPLRMTAKTRGFFISGKVVDLITKKPVESFMIDLFGVNVDPDIRETLKDVKGRFFFPLKREGEVTLVVRTSRHLPSGPINVKVPPGGIDDVRIELDPGRSLSGRVLDADTG